MKNIILASASPRRKELLDRLNIPYTIEPAHIEEHLNTKEPLPIAIQQLAKDKAIAVFHNHPDDLILSADTIVVIDNKVLGKPKDSNDHFQMLRSLSDHTHQVLTGVCFYSNKRIYTRVSINEVTFAHLSDEEINKYVNTKEGTDKAGGYAIQGLASRYIQNINGDYYAIVGLPIHMVYEELKNANLY